jgi:hypothetical protein
MSGQKVVAVRDLWTDGKDRLLVLAGTFGRIIGFQPADKHSPACHVVSFIDGNSTFCTSDEICEV